MAGRDGDRQSLCLQYSLRTMLHFTIQKNKVLTALSSQEKRVAFGGVFCYPKALSCFFMKAAREKRQRKKVKRSLYGP
jgi:hypothetical protein